MSAPNAFAASHGRGYDSPAGWLGQYLVGGVATYCLEITAGSPLGASVRLGDRAWHTMSADENARVSWAVATYGQRASDNWAAAVHLFVWSLADPKEYGSHGQSGDDYYVWRAPASARADILEKLKKIRAGASSVKAGTLKGSGSMSFQTEFSNNYNGTLTVKLSPSSARGSIKLTNGRFVESGTRSLAGLGGGSYRVVGVPPEDGAPYRISAKGNFSTSGGYAGKVALYENAGGSQQYTAGPGPKAQVSVALSASDPNPRSATFAPILRSQVAERYPAEGDAFTDNFVFSAGEDPQSGLKNPWPEEAGGGYKVVTATVTVYRTRATSITSGETIPHDAEVFDSFTVTTSAAEGPLGDYRASTTKKLESGYQYVAVSVIDAADQSPTTRAFLPEGYRWTDGWGVSSEIAIVPPDGRSAATQLEAQGFPVSDVASLDGLLFDGAQVRFHLYRRPDGGPSPLQDSDPEAIDPAATCTDETRVWTSGLQPAAEVVTGTAPSDLRPGVYDWRFEILDQAGEIVWGAPCGPISERTEIVQVIVETEAQTNRRATETVEDAALIRGTIEEGDTLAFAAYRAERDRDGQPICEPSNLVWASEAITLTPGVVDRHTVKSGPTMLPTGTYWWVETYANAADEVIHRGECGIPSETSVVHGPDLPDTGVDPQLIAMVIAAGIGCAVGVLVLLLRRLRTRR
ncbi:hypothetical protein [Homoserinibacter sp. GY 40078]|uniref:hypothetical protein n=1 Tax=Homoserinibacter sp. GY 40078 TaxID=2603275 RepID=UPI001C9CF4EE|nr:hypothetical protein [Homoserinibacter sp. GY 40078]